MTLFDILLPYQKTFALSQKKRKLWLSSRQIGKSFALAYLAVQEVLTSNRGQNALALCISTGARASGEFLKKCEQMAQAVNVLMPSIQYQASADAIKFNNGARILSLPSGNPASLRGYSADIVIIDECAFIERPEDVWASIAPTLTRNKDAKLVVASTPAGTDSWFYKLMQEAKCDPEVWHVQQTTIEDAVKDGLDVDIEELRKTISDPDTWDREYMCKFAASFSSLIDTSILDFYDEAPHFQAKYLGMDVGSRSDFTAIATLGLVGDTFYVDDIAMLHKAEYTAQIEIVKQLHETNGYFAGYIDQTGIGSALSEMITKQVSSKLKGLTFTVANKTPMFEDLRAKCFDHKMKFNKKIKDLILADFANVHRVVSEAGRVSYEAGRGPQGHSDATSSIILALRAAHDMALTTQDPIPYVRESPFGAWHSRLM